MVKTHRQTHGARLNTAKSVFFKLVSATLQLSTRTLLFVSIKFIRFYQLFLSPLIGPHCRFHPSCSEYSLASLKTHGFINGSRLSIVRLCKCHPGHPGGIDYPPAVSLTGTKSTETVEYNNPEQLGNPQHQPDVI